jgi:hypothetical protein
MTGEVDIVVRVAAGRLGDAVLRRVAGALGAQADLPIERIQDAALIVDAILGGIAADPVSAVLRRDDRGLEIAIGPLTDGEGDRMLHDVVSPEIGPIIQSLADRVWIDRARGPFPYFCVTVGRIA